MIKGLKIISDYYNNGIKKILLTQYNNVSEIDFLIINTVIRIFDKTDPYIKVKNNGEFLSLIFEVDDVIFEDIYINDNKIETNIYVNNILLNNPTEFERSSLFSGIDTFDGEVTSTLDEISLHVLNIFIPEFFPSENIKEIHSDNSVEFSNGHILGFSYMGHGFRNMVRLLVEITDTIINDKTLLIPKYLGFHPLLQKKFYKVLSSGEFHEALNVSDKLGQFIYENTDNS